MQQTTLFTIGREIGKENRENVEEVPAFVNTELHTGNQWTVFWNGRVCEAEFSQLFKGFHRAYILTYSVNVSWLFRKLHSYGYTHCCIIAVPSAIHGNHMHVTHNIMEVLNPHRRFTGEIERMLNDRRLLHALTEGRYELRTPTLKTHAKIAILKSETGKTRVIWGTANFTPTAITGQQVEVLEVLDDDVPDNASKIEVLSQIVQRAIEHSIAVVPHTVCHKAREHMERNKPFRIDIDDTKEMLRLCIEQISHLHTPQEIRHMIESLEETAEQVKHEHERLTATVSIVGDVTENVSTGAVFKPLKNLDLQRVLIKRTRRETTEFTDPRPVSYIQNGRLILDGEQVSATYSSDINKRAVEAVHSLISSYAEGTGQHEASVVACEALMYALQAPYMYAIRNLVYEAYGVDKLPYFPIFLLLAGEAGSGKTFLARNIATIYGGGNYFQYEDATKFRRGHVNDKAIAYMMQETQNATPIVVDEIIPAYFSSKNQKQRTKSVFYIKYASNTLINKIHSVLISTTNLHEFVAPPEVLRRVYYLPMSLPFDVKKGRIKPDYGIGPHVLVAFAYHYERVTNCLDGGTVLDGLRDANRNWDPLAFARRAVASMFEAAGRRAPSWMSEVYMRDELYRCRSKNTWCSLVQSYPECFRRCVLNGEPHYDVTELMNRIDSRSVNALVDMLPSGIVSAKKGVFLLRADRFHDFLEVGSLEELKLKDGHHLVGTAARVVKKTGDLLLKHLKNKVK